MTPFYPVLPEPIKEDTSSSCNSNVLLSSQHRLGTEVDDLLMMTSTNETLVNVNGVNYNISQIFYNGTEFDTSFCTPATCSLLIGTYTYLPNNPGNTFFAALFGLLFIVQIVLGVYFRTWGFLVSIAMGFGLESAAYVTRVMMRTNDFSRNVFIIYIYCITLGATFVSAAIYLCLARIVVAYGAGNSRLKPRTYSILFIFGDFIALSLQGAGGGMVQVAEVESAGLRTLIAGLAFQIFSLVAFVVVCIDFSWRVRRRYAERNPVLEELCSSWRWTGFLFALAVSTFGIIVRSAYRVAELQAGFHSDLFNDEALFMVLEGTMMSLVGIALTISHPGHVFRRQWRDADYSLRMFGASKSLPQSGMRPDRC